MEVQQLLAAQALLLEGQYGVKILRGLAQQFIPSIEKRPCENGQAASLPRTGTL
jgi:hypothetical protein